MPLLMSQQEQQSKSEVWYSSCPSTSFKLLLKIKIFINIKILMKKRKKKSITNLTLITVFKNYLPNTRSIYKIHFRQKELFCKSVLFQAPYEQQLIWNSTSILPHSSFFLSINYFRRSTILRPIHQFFPDATTTQEANCTSKSYRKITLQNLDHGYWSRPGNPALTSTTEMLCNRCGVRKLSSWSKHR